MELIDAVPVTPTSIQCPGCGVKMDYVMLGGHRVELSGIRILVGEHPDGGAFASYEIPTDKVPIGDYPMVCPHCGHSDRFDASYDFPRGGDTERRLVQLGMIPAFASIPMRRIY